MYAISLINMKGGVAKTTLAVNIADCLCERHNKKILLIDVDPQFNATQCLMSGNQYVEHITNNGDTIVNVFDRTLRPTIGIVEGPNISTPKNLDEIEPIQVKNNFYLLPGALELYRLEMAPGEGRENRLKRYLETLVENSDFDFIIIDTPPTPSVWMTSALIGSNFYLIPVKPDPISLTGIDLLQGIINEKKDNFGLRISCVGLVLTIVEENTLVFQRAKEALLHSERWKNHLYSKTLPKRTEVARQQLMQEFILDSNDMPLKQSITGITNELLTRIDQDGQR